MNSACRPFTPSPNVIITEERKPCRISRATLDSLPDLFRKAGYALHERGDLDIIEGAG
jgi:hypothetical protein